MLGYYVRRDAREAFRNGRCLRGSVGLCLAEVDAIVKVSWIVDREAFE